MSKLFLITLSLVLITSCASNFVETKEGHIMPKKCIGLKDQYKDLNFIDPDRVNSWATATLFSKLERMILSERVGGCGLVVFDINEKGKATNVRIIEQYPEALQIGKFAAANALEGKFEKWDGPKKNIGYFLNATFKYIKSGKTNFIYY